MAPKKRVNAPGPRGSGLNFRPQTEQSRLAAQGKKPLPEPTSVKQILLTMVIFVCKKCLFIDAKVKVAAYAIAVFFGSILADFTPVPKSYFTRTDNVMNQYFVKIGWGWTLLTVGVFVGLTSYTYCCGQYKRMIQHFVRLAVGTAMWYFWTTSFEVIEHATGFCSAKQGNKFATKRSCISGGFKWHGVDISGHVFILMYSSLLIIEEARAINGWEGIANLIRTEEYNRSPQAGDDREDTALGTLTTQQFDSLKTMYPKLTPYIKASFIWMTCLVIIWDVMLIATVLYFHIMIEKMLACLIAVLVWFLTYNVWYTLKLSPGPPGEGLFRYMDSRQPRETALPRQKDSLNMSTRDHDAVPTFCGMPLYGLRNREERENYNNEEKEVVRNHSVQSGIRRGV